MTRHKLIDGRWYLIRNNKPSNEGKWHIGMYVEHDNQFWIGVQGDNPNEYDEWIQIDPQFIWDESVE